MPINICTLYIVLEVWLHYTSTNSKSKLAASPSQTELTLILTKILFCYILDWNNWTFLIQVGSFFTFQGTKNTCILKCKSNLHKLPAKLKSTKAKCTLVRKKITFHFSYFISNTAQCGESLLNWRGEICKFWLKPSTLNYEMKKDTHAVTQNLMYCYQFTKKLLAYIITLHILLAHILHTFIAELYS